MLAWLTAGYDAAAVATEACTAGLAEADARLAATPKPEQPPSPRKALKAPGDSAAADGAADGEGAGAVMSAREVAHEVRWPRTAPHRPFHDLP